MKISSVKPGIRQDSSGAPGVGTFALTAFLAFGLLTAPAALAQDEAADEPAAEDTDAGSKGGLDVITVTSQYREQNLQSTPLAVTAISGEALHERNLTRIDELGSSVPNVTLTMGGSEFGNITQASIRGIGQGDFNFASEPAVGMYVDDVYYGTMFGTTFDLLDLERVEVLKGPQGTLFGKNTIGGAIRLISKKPQGDNSGYLEATYGDFQRIEIRGSADVSIVDDKLMMRIAAVHKQRDGYQDNLDFACVFQNEGPASSHYPGSLPQIAGGPDCKLGTFGGEDVRAARVQLRWIPHNSVEVNLSADRIDDDSEVQADTLLAVDNGPGSLVPAYNGLFAIPTYGIPYDDRFIPDDPYVSYATYTSDDGVQVPKKRTVDAWGFAGTVDVEFSDNLSFKSITGYRTYRGNIPHDADASPMSIQTVDTKGIGSDQWTQEIRFIGSTFSDRLDYTFGGFYYTADNVLHGPVILDVFRYIGLPFLTFNQNDLIEQESKSAYIHGIFHVTNQMNLTGGYRFTDESKSYHFDHSLPVAGIPGSGFFAAPDPAVTEASIHDWRAVADYQWTDDIFTYFQVSTGTRSGGINPRPFSPPQLTTYGPEKAKSYELGVKADTFGNRLRTNVALFYTDYKDRIVTQQILDNTGIPFTGPINLGSASIKGFEVEAIFVPVESIKLYVNWGYNDITLDPLPDHQPGFIDGDTVNGIAGTIPIGSTSPGIPDGHTVSAGAEYSSELGGNSGSLTARLDYSYRPTVYGDNRNDPLAATDPYSLLSGRITWYSPSNLWSVALSATNLTGEEYFINKFTLLPFGLGTLEGQPGRPREWAITVRREF